MKSAGNVKLKLGFHLNFLAYSTVTVKLFNSILQIKINSAQYCDLYCMKTTVY